MHGGISKIFFIDLFIIIFRPDMLNFHPYSILTRDTRVDSVMYTLCVNSVFDYVHIHRLYSTELVLGITSAWQQLRAHRSNSAFLALKHSTSNVWHALNSEKNACRQVSFSTKAKHCKTPKHFGTPRHPFFLAVNQSSFALPFLFLIDCYIKLDVLFT